MTDFEDRCIDIFIILCVVAVIVLKITGVITIPWLWISAIIWIPFLIGCIIAIGIILLAIIENAIEKIKEK
jgi:TRAP-type C4-dicarboxylate transport system permease small subunit